VNDTHCTTPWFCPSCGWEAPENYEPEGCALCAATLVRFWFPFSPETEAVARAITGLLLGEPQLLL
jgi:hypothetical protein